MVLFTVGYQGRRLDELGEMLGDAGVTKVLDVRDYPLSRKPGLSKTPLASFLSDRGVEYGHERRLGNPKPLRDWLKEGGEWAEFEEVYRDHLESCSADVLLNVAEEVKAGAVVCLLCYEANADECHRSLVAEAIKERSDELRVMHL